MSKEKKKKKKEKTKAEKEPRSIKKTIVHIFFSLAFGILGLLIVSNFFYAAFLMKGNSMYPAIDNNDIVICRKSADGLRQNQVIFYEKPNEPENIIIRRIVSINETSVLTKGDNEDIIKPVNIGYIGGYCYV